jgi:hypothetical protein
MIGDRNLTNTYPAELEAQARQTFPGMAHFAGTGPFATACRDCVFYNNKTRRCEKYFQLTRRKGASFPNSAPSCKYFDRRGVL